MVLRFMSLSLLWNGINAQPRIQDLQGRLLLCDFMNLKVNPLHGKVGGE